MGSKKEALETVVPLETFDLIAIMETWWDDSYNWNTTIEAYKLFRRDRQCMRGRRVALVLRNG